MRHYWKVMQYVCDLCAYRIEFYLEDGCEGPRDQMLTAPAVWVTRYGARVPNTAPATARGRYVLPVPFIAARCPGCEQGVLQHVEWGRDRDVDVFQTPGNAGVFHYPDDWATDGACGVPYLPGPRGA